MTSAKSASVDLVTYDNPMESTAEEESGAHADSVGKRLEQTALGHTASADEGEDETATIARLKSEWLGLLHPDTTLRGIYDMMQLFIMLYLAWLLPTRVAFTKSATGDSQLASKRFTVNQSVH